MKLVLRTWNRRISSAIAGVTSGGSLAGGEAMGGQTGEAVVDDPGHHGRPSWRGWLHFAALCMSIPAVGLLIAHSPSWAVRWSVVVYAVSLVGLFAASSAYHLLGHRGRRNLLFRKLDHCMIFVLIAGTYTPVSALVLPASWSVPLLIAIWLTAAAGIVLKVITLSDDRGTGSWLYIAMGWAALIALPKLLAELGAFRSGLLMIGGLLYTVGAVILARRRPDPAPRTFGYHELWHSFTIGAGACHFALVALLVAG